ncbi:hypothetical protein C8J56DRAFT_1045584 [Mycena floridula]|nr:hypothetical protein C8J56DRAFT_1045584 [Mycena floridula]
MSQSPGYHLLTKEDLFVRHLHEATNSYLVAKARGKAELQQFLKRTYNACEYYWIHQTKGLNEEEKQDLRREKEKEMRAILRTFGLRNQVFARKATAGDTPPESSPTWFIQARRHKVLAKKPELAGTSPSKSSSTRFVGAHAHRRRFSSPAKSSVTSPSKSSP